MHILYDWQVIFKEPACGVLSTIQFGRTVSETRVDTINVVEKCSVCSKKRGYSKDSTGKKWKLDVDYVETHYNEGNSL